MAGTATTRLTPRRWPCHTWITRPARQSVSATLLSSAQLTQAPDMQAALTPLAMSSCAPANSRIIDASRWLSSVCCHVMSDGLAEAGFVFEQPIGALLEEGLGPSRQIFTGYRRSHLHSCTMRRGSVDLQAWRPTAPHLTTHEPPHVLHTRSPTAKVEPRSPKGSIVCARPCGARGRQRKKTCVARWHFGHTHWATRHAAL